MGTWSRRGYPNYLDKNNNITIPGDVLTIINKTLTEGGTCPEQYRQTQEAVMYNFDKDCEDDREMLREDPYAEYPDFPKECRMTDMAQMDMVYC